MSTSVIASLSSAALCLTEAHVLQVQLLRSKRGTRFYRGEPVRHPAKSALLIIRVQKSTSSFETSCEPHHTFVFIFNPSPSSSSSCLCSVIVFLFVSSVSFCCVTFLAASTCDFMLFLCMASDWQHTYFLSMYLCVCVCLFVFSDMCG